jgi:PAS domain S-box-containing protein
MSRQRVNFPVRNYLTLLVVVIVLLSAALIAYALWTESLINKQNEIVNDYHLNSIRHGREIQSRLHYVRMFIDRRSLKPSDAPHQQVADSGSNVATHLHLMRTSIGQLKTIQEAFARRAEEHALIGSILDRMHNQFTFIEDGILQQRSTGRPNDSEFLGRTFNALKITMAQLVRLHTNSHQAEVSKATAGQRTRTLELILVGGTLLLLGSLIIGKILNIIKQTVVAQRKSEVKFRNMFEASSDAMFVIDPENDRVRDANTMACQLLKYSKEELLSMPISTIFQDDAAKFNDFVHNVIDRDSNCIEEIKLTAKTGEIVSVEPSISKVLVDDEGIYTAVLRDITERKKLERQNRQTQKMEAIGQLAGGIAHDFNNILMGVLGYTELAKQKAGGNEAVERHLDEVLVAGQRAKELVQQILAFSRQTEHERQPIELQSVVKEVCKLLRASLPTTVEIRQNFTKAPTIILGDPIDLFF